MRKLPDSISLSPLFIDTQFIPNNTHYFTIYNPAISSTPSILPYASQQTRFKQLSTKLSEIRVENMPKKASLLGESIKDIKTKCCKKYIDGQQIQITSNTKYIDLQAILSRKQPQTQKKERLSLCCIMMANKDEVIHLCLKWESQIQTVKAIVQEINSRYKVKLRHDQISLSILTISYKIQSDGFTSLIFNPTKINQLSQEIFSSNSLTYLGIEIIINKFSANQFIIQSKAINQKIIQIMLPNNKSLRFYSDKIKQYQIKELLGILGVEDCQSKGIKAFNRIFQPSETFKTIFQPFQGSMTNYITAEIAQQGEIFYNEVGKAIPVNENQLKKLLDQGVSKKIKTKASPLMLFNSNCSVNSNKQSRFKMLYHIIHKYIRNYFTHFNTFFDNSMSIRIAKGLYEEIQKLPTFRGETFRKIGYQLRYNVGEAIDFNNFVITTTECQHIAYQIPTAYKSKETLVKIWSITGRKCSTLSPFEKLQEVVFLPFTKFQVTDCDEDEKTIYLNLEQIPKIQQQSKCTIILWVDQKQKEGRSIFTQYLQWFKSSVHLFQFKSTAQLTVWISKYKLYAKDETDSRFIIITNMRRNQMGKENPIAGIDTIEVVTELIPKAKIIVYIGNIQFTIENLQKYGIDPKNLDILNTKENLARKIREYCLQAEPVQNSLIKPKGNKLLQKPQQINKISTQNWQVYMTNAKQDSIKKPQIQKQKIQKPKITSSILQLGSNDYEDWDKDPPSQKNKMDYMI